MYNYSDMTGSTLTGAPDNGTWTAVHDAGMDDVTWKSVSWTADEPGDSSITVTVASSEDGATYGPEIEVTNGGNLSMADGRYLRLTVSFMRSSKDEDSDSFNDSPVLYDISVDAVPPNEPPEAQCKDAELSLGTNGQVVLSSSQVDNGSSDPDGDPITFSLSRTDFSCSDVGVQNAVTLTVTDDGGLFDSCVSNVTVVDNTAPDVKTKDITVQLDSNGNASITADDIDSGSADNCGISSMTVSPSSFTCADVGANTVTLTVTDNNGNVGTATATVTVADTLAPTNVQANAQSTITPPDAPISFTATATDNCSATVEVTDYRCYGLTGNGKQHSKMQSCVVSVSGDTITITDSGGVGDNIVWTIVATDQSGNTTSAEGHVEVENPGKSRN